MVGRSGCAGQCALAICPAAGLLCMYAAGGWLGARNGVKAMREDLSNHIKDGEVHNHRRKDDP